MKKLFKLKEWLTIPDTAKYLSMVFNEDVSEADVLRFALDGYLKISVNFVNYTRGSCGNIVSWEDTKWTMFPNIKMKLKPSENVSISPEKTKESPPNLLEQWNKIPEVERENFYPMLMSEQIDSERYLNLDDEVVIIKGIWDLPMIGSEQLDIEHAYQCETGGPAVTLQNLNGAFVEKSYGQMCQLQESFDENEYQSGSRARLEKLKAKISNEKIDKSEAEKLLNKHKQDRKKYLEKRKSRPKSSDYYPAGGLPEDSILVIRTESLRNFEQRASEETKKNSEEILTTTERNTLLTIIGVTVKNGYGHDLNKPYEAAKEIQKDAEKLGIKISDDTIAKKLKEAKKIMDDKAE